MFGSKKDSPNPQQPADPSAQLPATIAQQSPVADSSEHQVAVNQSVPFMKASASVSTREIITYTDKSLETDDFVRAKTALLDRLVEQIDFVTLNQLSREQQRPKVSDLVDKYLADISTPLNAAQITILKDQLLDDIFGFGPMEPLLNDPDISDIMINGPHKVFVEKAGKILMTDVRFADDRQLLSIIQRIVARVGRRVDESSPMVDARMPDGSRFNAIIPPLALNGSLVSIRKFKKNKLSLADYVGHGSMSEQMYRFLDLCGFIRMNMIVSGGTGSGKTTLLNALSGSIEDDERIITIEDAAELQLQQPHVLRLETRPASTEGKGEVNQRQLVRNALRMRPDRIILGEIRGDEVIDVLSAMNTGHDGSMATIHANNAKDCLSRVENLVGMSGIKITSKSLRQQIASAIQLIIQVERMKDGVRRIVAVEEIVGMEGDIITTQTLFSFKSRGIDEKGVIQGEFICHGIRPRMLSRAEYYGKDKEVLACFQVGM